MDKKFWEASFTLAGTTIGAGILGLPYVFSKPGFLIGFFWLIFLGVVMIFINLSLGEVILRTKGKHHLIGYAEKYIGKKGKKIMLIAMVFGIYSALLAYLLGEGKSLAYLFFKNFDYSFYFSIIFWIIMTLFLREGLRGLRKIETWGVLGILILVVAIFLKQLPLVNIENLIHLNLKFSSIVFPFGVILFSLLGFTSIPEMRMILNKDEKKLKKAIFVGVLIPIAVYTFFTFIFIAVLGTSIPEIATLGFGRLVTLLGIFTMGSCYFVLSFALKDAFNYDLKEPKKLTYFLVSVIPLGMFLLVYYFKTLSFVKILGIGGVICGGIIGTLILLMNKNSKLMGNRKPEYEVPINKTIIFFLILIFLFGIISEVIFGV